MKIGPKESQRRELREAHQVQSLGTHNATSGVRNAPLSIVPEELPQAASAPAQLENGIDALARIRASRNARQQRYRNKRKAKGESK